MLSVSVVVPCHNDARYLGAAIESILAQSPPVFEVVVVDDGSTDASAEVARSFGGLVRIHVQERRGVSAARNAGAARSTGDILAFLDADDLWPDGSLQARIQLLQDQPEAGYAYGEVEQFLSEDLPLEQAASLRCPPGRIAGRIVGAMAIRRAIFEQIGGFDERIRIGEAIDLAARLEEAGAVGAVANSLVMRRRIHGANTMIQERENHAAYLHVLKSMLDRRARKPIDGG